MQSRPPTERRENETAAQARLGVKEVNPSSMGMVVYGSVPVPTIEQKSMPPTKAHKGRSTRQVVRLSSFTRMIRRLH